MRITEIETPSNEQHVVPESVVRMAEAIITANGPSGEAKLRRNIGADEGQPLQSALENWLVREIKIDDEEIAYTIFRLVLARLELDAGEGYGHWPC
ncbi:UNVERIFIED_CONTAM: hypothetical protein K0B97_03135 [Spiribacter pallidus]